jgi:hypothetical protein
MAADSMQTFLNKHVEKIVLAAAIIIFVVALVVFVAMRDTVFGNQEQVRTNVERAVKALVDARQAPTSLEKALTPDERAALGIDQALPTGEQYLKDRGALPAAWDASVDKWIEPKVGGPPPRVIDVVAPEIVGITDLQVFQGRGTTAEPVTNAVFKLEKPALSDIVWAGVVGQVDLTNQLAEYNKAHAPLDPSGILISKVELQRRELKPDGTWSEWKPVMPAVASAAAAKWPKPPANPRDKAAAGAWYTACKTLQAEIRRMPFYTLVGKDKAGQTADMVAGAVAGVEQPDMKRPEEAPPAAAAPAPAAAAPAAAPEAAPAAPAGTASPWATAAPTVTQSAAGTHAPTAAARKHVTATLWAYDATVEPRKTYQYQMRVSVVSPIYSLQEIKEGKTRWALEFSGSWSAPSREVTIPGLVDIFFVGVAGSDKANLEVHRWILSQWVIQPSVQCNFGGPVAYVKRQKLIVPGAKPGAKEATTAEAINVDLNAEVLLVDVMRAFLYVPEGAPRAIRTNILIYADARGQLNRRIEWDDKNASRAARAEREGGTGPVAPPPKTTTPPPPPPKAKAERTERPAVRPSR